MQDSAEETAMFAIIVIVVSVASAVICNQIAKHRGGRAIYWSSMGLIFGPFAIPFAFFARPVRPPKAGGPANASLTPGEPG